MRKSKYTEEQEKEIQMLRASNEMFERTKEEVKLRGNDSALKRIELAQDDIFEQVKKIDPQLAENMRSESKSSDEYDYGFYSSPTNNDLSVMDTYEKLVQKEDVNLISSSDVKDESINVNSYTPSTSYDTFSFNNIGNDVQYDIISLPSKGECYKEKVSKLPVSYLTAFDENLITSPNLYKDGLIVDFLLKQKVLGNSINLDDLCSGDVDAIILFLRATSYGVEFPIIAKDPINGQEIESIVDLTTLKYKEFNLVGDENGHFDFELPVSKDKIKFRFLTRKDIKILDRLNNLESDGVKAKQIRENINSLTDIVKHDKLLSGKDKQEIIKDLGKMKPWIEKLESNNPLPYSKMITNRLELSIVSVNDNTDRQFISKYVKNMGAKDSLMLRRYILENEPGVNFEIEVERPESLGGGSFKTFLEWDDSVFLNIA